MILYNCVLCAQYTFECAIFSIFQNHYQKYMSHGGFTFPQESTTKNYTSVLTNMQPSTLPNFLNFNIPPFAHNMYLHNILKTYFLIL